jgi:hypothetical protein
VELQVQGNEELGPEQRGTDGDFFFCEEEVYLLCIGTCTWALAGTIRKLLTRESGNGEMLIYIACSCPLHEDQLVNYSILSIELLSRL